MGKTANLHSTVAKFASDVDRQRIRLLHAAASFTISARQLEQQTMIVETAIIITCIS